MNNDDNAKVLVAALTANLEASALVWVAEAAPEATEQAPAVEENLSVPRNLDDAARLSEDVHVEEPEYSSDHVASILSWVNEKPAADENAAAVGSRLLSKDDIELVLGEAFKNIASGSAAVDDFGGFFTVSGTPAGADRLGNALEALVAGNDGPHKMMSLMRQAGANPDAARAFAQALANVAEEHPTRTAGTFLLTTDAPGGVESVARLFSELSQDSRSATSLATMLRHLSGNADAACGLSELLDTLTAPHEGERANAANVARSFAEATRWKSGSRELTETFTQLLDSEGGARGFGRLFGRLTASTQGCTDASQTLRRMSFDATGTEDVGRLVARASESRGGAQDIVDAFTRIAATENGKRDVATLLSRLCQNDFGARFLANAASEPLMARSLGNLLDLVAENERGRELVSTALANLTDATAAARLAARAKSSAPLAASLAELGWTGPAAETAPQVRLSTESFGLMASTSSRFAPRSEREPAAVWAQLAEGVTVERTFRPGDIYSPETLRQARLCPECGFRLNRGGACPRCAETARRVS